MSDPQTVTILAKHYAHLLACTDRLGAAEKRWQALREWLEWQEWLGPDQRDTDDARAILDTMDALEAEEGSDAIGPHVTPEMEARLAEFKKLAVERIASADELLERVRRELESDDE